MELPAYHWPTLGNVLRSMWERGWSFIKKAGTIILLSTIFVWFTTYFGWADGQFGMLEEDQIDSSILAAIGGAICWIFKPLGWGNWQATVASITGLVAKENIVGTLGILYGAGEGTVWQNIGAAFTPITGYSFLDVYKRQTGSPWSPWARPRPTGRTTDCSATAGICSASVPPLTARSLTSTPRLPPS